MIVRQENMTPHRHLPRFAVRPRLLFFTLLPLLLSACAEGAIQQLDRETYMVTGQSRLNGNNGAAANAVLKADAYCKDRGKRMQLTGSDASDGVFGVWPSKSVVMFKCVA